MLRKILREYSGDTEGTLRRLEGFLPEHYMNNGGIQDTEYWKHVRASPRKFLENIEGVLEEY